MPLVTIPGGETLVFIHVPKTGGTSIEHYFIKKGVPTQQLITSDRWHPNHPAWVNGVSLQHQRYQEILTYAASLGINITGMRRFAVVRNPYTRVVSDLFFYRKIRANSSAEDVFGALNTYIQEYKANPTAYDNHARPQSDLLVNHQGQIDPSVRILRCETLTSDMQGFGFADFDIFTHKNQLNVRESEYMKFLNKDSLNLINTIYSSDFTNFGYSKIE